MDTELLNLYIQKLTTEMTELVKTKILLQTQLEFNQQIVIKQAEEIANQAQLIDELKKKSTGKKKKVTDLSNNGDDTF